MEFKILFNRISPRLRSIARSRNGRGLYIDESDLYQEMCIYLWRNYNSGIPPGINDSYIIKGCEFHILNYIRMKREKVKLISLEQPINEDGSSLADILPCAQEAVERPVERNLVFDKIMKNGFSRKEKQVLSLLMEGYTARETARKLSVSHVMVLKHKKSIIKKWHKKGYQN